MPFRKLLLITLLMLLFAFVWLYFSTRPMLLTPRAACEPVALEVKVMENGILLKEKSNLYEVKTGAAIAIEAQVVNHASNCELAGLTLEWIQGFASTPTNLTLISNGPTHQILRLTADSEPSGDFEADQISINVRQSAATKLTRNIHLKIKQETSP